MGEGDLEHPSTAEGAEKPLVGKTETEKKEEEEKPQSSAFWTKFSLAMSMSFWVTLFYVPVVVPAVHQWFFIDLGLPNILGSPDFEAYWPNTVQLIVFTVYFSTGSTVNLAWQGLAGTIVAGMNQAMMGKLFPMGGKCRKVGHYTGSGIRGSCEEYADPNYATYQMFVWFDVFFFLFLVLSSNAKENTMKFSMSWHIAYMMAFMSSTGYTASHAVNITSCFGVMLAILITLVPSKTAAGITFKQMASNNLEGHPESIAKTVSEISRAMVKFMFADKPKSAEDRYRYKVNKTAIQMKVDSLAGMAGAMESDWQTSWWEGWIYGLKGGPRAVTEFRRVRMHCGIFAQAFQDDIGGFDDVAFVMKKAVTAMDAVDYKLVSDEDLEEISQERQHVRGLLEDLNKASMELLTDISSWKKAQQASADVLGFAAKVKTKQEDVNAKFSALYNGYRQWMQQYPVQQRGPARQVLRTNMSIFVFSILQLSKEVVDLADKVVKRYEKSVNMTESDLMKKTAKGVFRELVATFFTGRVPNVVKAFTDAEKRSFVFRNLFSIGLCFVMGNVMQGNVFQPPFNPMMAGTLAVLLSHFPGSAFYKNLMRLLGLAIGNALPIIMLAVASLFGSLMPYAHLAAFFLFELYFCLMYYTSPEWSYVGCVVAGFGCYSFTTETWSADSFGAAYCKIGQVTAAICVQIIVDMVDTAARKTFPQDVVVLNMRKMTMGLVGVFRLLEQHIASAEHSKELIDRIRASAGELKGIMASQETLVSECQSKTTIIAGPRPAFKLELYTGALAAIKELLGEVDALCLMDEFSEKVGRDHGEWFDQRYRKFFEHVLDSMKQTFTTLMTILEKTDESQVKKRDVRVLLTAEDPTGHTEAMRMAVVKRIMNDTLAHVLEIERLCCASGVMEFQVA